MKEINKNDPIYEMTQSNQRGWDRLADTHYRTYDIDKLIAGEPLLNEIILNEVGDVSDKSLIHLLCHIGTDTLSWALQGADVTGVDISHNALKYARKIAERMNIQSNFIQSNILEVSEKINQKYDVVFASTGVLCWLPDIQDFAKSVRKLLKDDGFFYLFDGHPFRNVLEDESGSVSEERIQGSYFRKQVWRYENMGDYTDPELLVPINSYEWDWTLGEIVTAFCDAGMRIVFLHEFPQYFYSGYTPYDVEDNKIERYPCTFSLKASVL